MLLGITAGAALLGMAAPVLMRMAKGWLFPARDFRSWVYGQGSFFIPLLVVFFSLSLFYRLAPRRPTRFAEVWAAALCATILLRAVESLFVIYLKDFATLNAVYGAFGGIMALLLWIYLSGCVFIFGACLCAGQAEALGQPATPMTSSRCWPVVDRLVGKVTNCVRHRFQASRSLCKVQGAEAVLVQVAMILLLFSAYQR